MGDDAECPTGVGSSTGTLTGRRYLGSTAPHDVLWDGIDLVLHLHLLEAIVCHPYSKHTEVGSSEVQSQELSMFCRQRRVYRQCRERQDQTASWEPAKTSNPESLHGEHQPRLGESGQLVLFFWTHWLFLSLRLSHRVTQACLQSPRITGMSQNTQLHVWLS